MRYLVVLGILKISGSRYWQRFGERFIKMKKEGNKWSGAFLS